MRRRILVSTLAVVVLAVAMLAVPLLVVVERYVDPPDQLRAGGLVLGLAVLAVAAAMVVAARAARRTVAPLSQLATDAARLAGGDLGPTGRRYGAEELDHVAEALDSSAVRLGELVRRERQLAADVSHQLRSRLTALSMRLEEVAALSNTAVRAEAEAALDQVDRMVHIVDELLDQARTERAHNAVELDVAEHLAALRADWDDAFRVSGRTLRIDTPGGLDEEPRLRARATPGHVAQALGVLIENALQHGAGTVTVAARARGEHVVSTWWSRSATRALAYRIRSSRSSSIAACPAATAPGSVSRSPGRWSRPTRAGWSCDRRGRPSSPSTCPGSATETSFSPERGPRRPRARTACPPGAGKPTSGRSRTGRPWPRRCRTR